MDQRSWRPSSRTQRRSLALVLLGAMIVLFAPSLRLTNAAPQIIAGLAGTAAGVASVALSLRLYNEKYGKRRS